MSWAEAQRVRCSLRDRLQFLRAFQEKGIALVLPVTDTPSSEILWEISLGRYLGIDVGGSAMRWHLREDGAAPRIGQATGFSGYMFRPEIKEKAERTLRSVADQTGRVDRIVAGFTGLTPPSPEAEVVKTLLSGAFQTPQVVVMTDSRLAYLSAFAPGEGILVYAGTGSIGAHVDANGKLLLVGGKGVLIDDAGGGYWIAMTALRAVLRGEDHAPGSRWESTLGKALAKRLGGSDWASVRQAIYGADRGAIGMLAIAVGEAAHEGDELALQTLDRAGQELAELARMISTRASLRRPVALAGRAGGLHPAILEGMRSALPGWTVNRLEADYAQAAALLAGRPSFFDDPNNH